jgi:uncharacterized membrane protein
LKSIDGDRVRAAIREAEEGTSGRIGVHVSDRRIPDPLDQARAHFHRARLHEHPDANAVLILVAPKSRKFAVYGGDAIHSRLGEEFWKQLVAAMTPYFVKGQPTQGLVNGIERIGRELKMHFPATVDV